LRAAFPAYVVSLVKTGDKARFEAVSRTGDGDPWCVISTDAREIWQELRGH
jgi:hypothetical protein